MVVDKVDTVPAPLDLIIWLKSIKWSREWVRHPVPHFATPIQVVKLYHFGFCLIFSFRGGAYTPKKSIDTNSFSFSQDSTNITFFPLPQFLLELYRQDLPFPLGWYKHNPFLFSFLHMGLRTPKV